MPGKSAWFHRLGSWIGFGVGAVGVIVGSITGALAMVRSDDVATACEYDICNPPDFPLYDAGIGLAHTTTVSFSIGGAGIAAGVVVLLLSRKGKANKKDETGIRLTPTANGIGIGGTF